MWPVPATNVKLHVVSGATIVTYFGLARMIRSAMRTRKSMPPAASITDAPKITARMISKTSTGGDVGLTPNNDGNVIRLQVPELTEDRRKDMVKMVHGVAEEGKVAVRNIRRDVLGDLRDLKKDGEVGEDDERRGETALQERTDAAVAEIDALVKGKEEEILTV